MDEILSKVKASLNESAAPTATSASGAETEGAEEQAHVEVYNEDTEGWDYDQGDEFDDTGEGAGVEGDLDKEDDE